MKDIFYGTHTWRSQPNTNSYRMVPFVEQGYLFGIVKGANCCIRFLRRSPFDYFYYSKRFGLRLSSCSIGLGLFHCIRFLVALQNSVFAIFRVPRDLIIFFLWGGTRFPPSFRLLTKLLISVFGSFFAFLVTDAFCWSLADFLNALLWCGLTTRALTIWSLLFSFSSCFCSTNADRSGQHSLYYCFCCSSCQRQLKRPYFGLPMVKGCGSVNHFDGSDDSYLSLGSVLSCTYVGLANTRSFCFRTEWKTLSSWVAGMMKTYGYRSDRLYKTA